MNDIGTINADCLAALDAFPDATFDLTYLDPPFLTQKQHTLTTRDGSAEFAFQDVWNSPAEYIAFLRPRVEKMRRTLKRSGSLFFHCDRNASHHIRLMLDAIFGAENFQSEIIWSYRRWSNTRKGLLPSHQTIFFYSKTADFKFFPMYGDYSETTNIEQIMQKRERDGRNKSVYARNERGETQFNGPKQGTPLGDVWDIPYLNPKARERAGYPTQKPILLLERILRLVTEPNDRILDPFCGSGTTLVAAKGLGRCAVGVDIAPEAIELTNQRLREMIKTESRLLKKGRADYLKADADVLTVLRGIDYFPVQRNNGIDAILKEQVNGKFALVRIQRAGEPLCDALTALRKAGREKGDVVLLLLVTEDNRLPLEFEEPEDAILIYSAAAGIAAVLNRLRLELKYKPHER